jgi:hypothetical protein
MGTFYEHTSNLRAVTSYEKVKSFFLIGIEHLSNAMQVKICKNRIAVLAEGGDTTVDKDGSFSSGGSVSEPPIWLTACHISIVFERCRHKVLSDSQASGNLMTRSFADEHGFPVKQNFQAFQMIDGTKILSTGFTWVLCGIKNNTASVHHRLFYIFERLHVPVLIGRSFWEESQSRRSISASRVCDEIHYQCIPLMFHENGKNKKVVMSALDTGIVSNLMSLGYARRERLSMMAPLSHQIRASNGRLVSIVGTVRVNYSLDLSKKFLSIVYSGSLLDYHTTLDLTEISSSIRTTGWRFFIVSLASLV